MVVYDFPVWYRPGQECEYVETTGFLGISIFFTFPYRQNLGEASFAYLYSSVLWRTMWPSIM